MGLIAETVKFARHKIVLYNNHNEMRPDYPDLFISPTPQIESPLHWDTNPVKFKELLTALDVDKAISTLSGIESDISAWSYVPKNNDETGGQIDLVIQRADRVINLCEMKYS